MSNIYLDNNATTAVEPEVSDAMFEVMGRPLNPSSSHRMGRAARSIVEIARTKIAEFVGADDSYRVVFTSSGTEANNLAIIGFDGQNVFSTDMEHPSVVASRKKTGGVVATVTADGIIDVEVLEKLLQLHRGKSLVSIMLANNETGIIQPIDEVVRVARKWGALIHCDAAQAFGKIDVDIKALDVDMLTISAHKFGGPKGAAALILKKDVNLSAQIIGGGQEQGFRSGTENVVAICGFGKAVEVVRIDEKVRALRDRLEREIKQFAPDAVIFGQDMPRLPNTSYIAMPCAENQMQLIHFDMNDIAVSAGSACSSGRIEPSHVLKAMGVKDEIAKTAIRVSLGKNNTDADIDAFIASWKQIYSNVNKAEAA